MTRYRVDINRAQFDAADVVVLDDRGHARPDDTNVVHIFTDDDLGRGGHMRLNGYGKDFVHTALYITHVAIPIEQYVRIFGEP